jgi:hypothetical protein
MKDLARLYDTFTPIERMRLFIEAAARRDIAELDRLNNTCPRLTYRTEDWKYSRLKIVLYDLALAQSGDRSKFELLACFALTIIVATEGDNDTEQENAEAVSMFTDAVTAYRAKSEAWERFCRQIGIKRETAETAFGLGQSPVIQVIESVAESLDLAPGFDEQKVVQELASLEALWDKHADTGG